MSGDSSTPEERFWRHAAPLLGRGDVSRSTMMALPCLRVEGAFFAAFDRRTGDLLVKLREGRVHGLVRSGRAAQFAPAGRTFREWAAVPPGRSRSWPKLLGEALEFVRAGAADLQSTRVRRVPDAREGAEA